MSFTSEFKSFIAKGNVIDLAVGVVIGAAFGKVVDALVSGLIMPPIGLLIGGVNFTELKVILKPESVDAAGKIIPAVALSYGVFLQAVLNFLIIALAIFTIVVKPVNKLKKHEESAPAVPAPATKEEILLTEIRDLLKK